MRFGIFQKRLSISSRLLVVLLAMAIIPMVVLTLFTLRSSKKAVSNEVERGLVHRAVEMTQRVTMLLESVTMDLETLKQLPRNAQSYSDFSRAKRATVWTRVGTNQDFEEVRLEVPLYREIVFIDLSGHEKIRVDNVLDAGSLVRKRYQVLSTIASPAELRDVSRPENTLFKTEDYFLRSLALSEGEIYVGHLTGWYVTPSEQLGKASTPEEAIDGRRYDGVIRFAAPVYNKRGGLDGVVVLALDHVHLREITLHTDPLSEQPLAFAPYAKGNYAYLFDDEGWIIAHQKLWNLRGLNPDGTPVEPFKNVEGTNKGPVNLLKAAPKDIHLRQTQMMQDIKAHQSGVYHNVNIGLDGTGRRLQAQAYAPILFARGDYKHTQTFGGVMMTANLTTVHQVAAGFLHYFYVTLLLVAVGSILVSLLMARSITRPLSRLAKAAREIATGNLDHTIELQGGDEIAKLGEDFNRMAAELKERIQRETELQRRITENEKREKLSLTSRMDRLEKELAEKPFENFIAQSRCMKELLAKVKQVASTDVPVLLLGERGTGKEMIATTIHGLSARRSKPHLRVNCGAIVENLVESELFGYVRGAFTGAERDKIGFFEAASGGTLFLDEIGEMGPALQVKLLRVLQEKKVIRVGETGERPIDTRLIFATNQDLPQLMSQGRFRPDLYDRLNVVSIYLPPLRERREDIVPLAHHFLRAANLRHRKNILGFSEGAVETLLEASWKGNIRELENAVERAVVQTEGNMIEKKELAVSPELDHEETLFPLPDMTIHDLKSRYAKHIRKKYQGKPLKDICALLDVDWNTLRKYLSVFLLLLVTQTASAWGPTGHRVVGAIAERYLTHAAKQGAARLLGPDSFAEASTWADEVRSDPNPRYRRFEPWHYVSLEPDDATSPRNPDGDVIWAITEMERRLRDPHLSRDEKAEALRLLIHFVGDIHQPLHVGHAADLGGNRCFVRWFGESTNLHRVWDDQMIEAMHLSFTELAAFIDPPPTHQVQVWQQSSVEEWARESMAIRDAEVYPFPLKPQPKLSYAYLAHQTPVIEQRLLQAGVRLAGILNRIFP